MENNKRKIGIDMDDTLFDFVDAFRIYANQTYKTNIKREDFVTYSFQAVLKDKTEMDSIRKVFEFYNTDFFKKMPPFPGSVNAINHLKKENSLYVVTSRPDFLYNETMNQLWNNFRKVFLEVFFSSNYYTGDENSGKTKAEICIKKGIPILIDDSLEYALQCAEKGVNVLLLDAPWNLNGEHKGIMRVKDWNEILEKLK